MKQKTDSKENVSLKIVAFCTSQVKNHKKNELCQSLGEADKCVHFNQVCPSQYKFVSSLHTNLQVATFKDASMCSHV